MSKLSNRGIKLTSSIEFVSNRNRKNFQDLYVKEIFLCKTKNKVVIIIFIPGNIFENSENFLLKLRTH